ncbi:MAG: hypothetical protein K2X82_03285 [Gemmataceae bacterium]|nr:hypothetical protein [Gemmataceae bacterium]
MRVLAERWKTPLHLAFGPATQLAVAYSSGLVVWDAATGEQVARCRYTAAPVNPIRPQAVFFPPDGRAVCVADSALGLCPFRLPGLVAEPHDRADRYFIRAAVAADGRRIIIHQLGPREGDGLCGYRWDDGRPVPEWQAPTAGYYATGLGFFPDGTRYAAVEHPLWTPTPAEDLRPRVRVRTWPGGAEVGCAPSDRSEAGPVAVSPDGRRVAVRAGTHLLAWPASLAGEPLRADTGSRRHFTGIAFHPSGQFLAATSNDATVKLYDAATLALVRTFTWNIGKLKAVAFSADGTLAAAAGEAGRVVVWDVDL